MLMGLVVTTTLLHYISRYDPSDGYYDYYCYYTTTTTTTTITIATTTIATTINFN